MTKALSTPIFQSEVLERLSAVSAPHFAAELRDQLGAVAVAGVWQFDPKRIETTLVRLASEDELTPSEMLAVDQRLPVHLGPLAAALLAVVLVTPPLWGLLVQIGQDSINTVSFLLALVDGVYEASAEVRGLVLLLAIAASLVAIRDASSPR